MKKGGWLVALGLLAAAPAAAQVEPGLYLGGSVGYSQFKDACKHAAVPCDANDEAWRVFGGYQFSRYWAVELGYGDLGAATGSGPFAGGTGSFQLEVEEAWDLTAVFLIPVTTRLSALGRVGMYRARTTVDQQVTGFTPTHDAGTNSGFSYGAGAEYTLGPIGLRAEWQRYDNVGTAATQPEEDIDVFSIGLLWRF
jgi:OOP family OmpA-OmpF porin